MNDFRSWLEGLAEAEATVPARIVLDRLKDGSYDTHQDDTVVVDLTCEDVANELGRTAACIRGWCRAGKLPGSYRLQQREWRIPAAALRAFQDAQASGQPPKPSRPRRGQPVDLAAWRRTG